MQRLHHRHHLLSRYFNILCFLVVKSSQCIAAQESNHCVHCHHSQLTHATVSASRRLLISNATTATSRRMRVKACELRLAKQSQFLPVRVMQVVDAISRRSRRSDIIKFFSHQMILQSSEAVIEAAICVKRLNQQQCLLHRQVQLAASSRCSSSITQVLSSPSSRIKPTSLPSRDEALEPTAASSLHSSQSISQDVWAVRKLQSWWTSWWTSRWPRPWPWLWKRTWWTKHKPVLC